MSHQFVHEWFSRTASQYPTSIAIETPNRMITYQELERRSNLVAQSLVASGVAHGDVIAIFAEDGALIVEAFLGALKCGGAFMPIPPDQAESRIEAMLKKAKPGWV